MLYIRTDMNPIIATGHVMRCLAIADAAKSMGEDSIFILADNQAAELLEKRGYSYMILNMPWDHMDNELPVLEKVIKDYHIKRILIDSYQVTEKYLSSLTLLVQTYYIDDMNSFFYPVTGIICYANYWKQFQYSDRYKKTELYLGTKYAPLRTAFCNCKRKKINAQIEKILLLSGGADNYQVLNQILERLDFSLYQQVNVVCGQYNKQYDYLKEKNKSYTNVHIYKSVSNIEQLMIDADVTVSAGGTTLYELCAVGTPTISYVIADNQIKNVKQFHEDGIIAYAGDIRTDNVISNILKYLELYANQNIRYKKSEKMQKLIDGKGAFRIAESLIRNRSV